MYMKVERDVINVIIFVWKRQIKKAKEEGYDYFTTALSIRPYEKFCMDK